MKLFSDDSGFTMQDYPETSLDNIYVHFVYTLR